MTQPGLVLASAALVYVFASPAALADDRLLGTWMRVSGHGQYFAAALEAIAVADDMSVETRLWHGADPACDTFTTQPAALCGRPDRVVAGKLLADREAGTLKFAPGARTTPARSDPRDDFLARPFRFWPGGAWRYEIKDGALVLQNGPYRARYARTPDDMPALVHAVAVTGAKSLTRQSCWIHRTLSDPEKSRAFATYARAIKRVRDAVVLPFEVAQLALAKAEQAKAPLEDLRAAMLKARAPFGHLVRIASPHGPMPDKDRIATGAKAAGVAETDLRTWIAFKRWLESARGKREDAFYPGYDTGGKACTTDTSEAWFARRSPAAFKAEIRAVCRGRFGKLPQPELFEKVCQEK